MKTIDRLNAAGLTLPSAENPSFNYLPISVHQGIVWMAGQIAKINGKVPVQGQVSVEVPIPEAADQMKRCAMQALSHLQNHLGDLDRIGGIIHMNAYVACPADFDGISALADQASAVFIAAFSEAGRHPRSVLGVNRLPQNAPVMIDLRLWLAESG